MPGIFATGVQQVTSGVSTSAVLVWDTDATSTTTFGPLGSQTVGNVLKDLIINNTGTATCFIGTTSGITDIGAPVAPGGSMILYGYVATVTASSATGDLYAITAAGTTSVEVGLATTQGAVV